MQPGNNQFDGNTFEHDGSHTEGNNFENVGQESEVSVVPEAVEGNDADSHNFVSAQKNFNENNQDMSYIFSAAFGVVDLHDIDNDPRFVEVSRKKGFKKKSALPTPKSLKEEIE